MVDGRSSANRTIVSATIFPGWVWHHDLDMTDTELVHTNGGRSTGVDWLDEDEMRAWRTLLAAHARLARVLDEELEEAHGVSLQDHEVLIHLSEAAGHRLRMADLADLLLMSRSGLSRRVDRMVADDLVHRVRCSSDGRGVWAEMTAMGRRCLEEATPTHVEGVRRHFVSKLTRDQLMMLTAALEPITGRQSGVGCGQLIPSG